MDNEYLPPWPEWSDAFINDTKWSTVRSDQFKFPPSHGALPERMIVTKWRRPSDFSGGPDVTWMLTSEDEPFDLISANEHLLEHKVMRWITSSLMCLHKMGRANPLDPKFYPQAPGTPEWKPWHHIYSTNKLQKGQPSEPKYNSLGLYFVRLFYLGKWRRITVDDYFPYDSKGRLLLPSLQKKSYLWLQILSKALLQIASLSWTSEDDVVEFSPITCLSGWIQYRLDCRSMSLDNVWKVIKLCLIMKTEESKRKNEDFCLTCNNFNSLNCEENYNCERINARILMGVISETEREIADLTPSEEHLVYFFGAKKEPVGNAEDLPDWKKFRWFKWAVEKKWIDPPGTFVRTVNVFSPLSNLARTGTSRQQEPTRPMNHFQTKTETGLPIHFDETGHSKKNENKNDEPALEDNLDFLFGEIFPYLKHLEVYMKLQDFKKVISTNQLDELLDELYKDPVFEVKKEPVKIMSKAQAGQKKVSLPSPRDVSTPSSPLSEEEFEDIGKEIEKEPCKYFYLYSDTMYCKNIYINLGVYKNKQSYGYMICEQYNWKSVSLGPLLAGIKTVGSKTCQLQLGPGVQVCRVFCSFPTSYHVTIFSETDFAILTEDKLVQTLATYSKAMLDQGERMLQAFTAIHSAIPNCTEHTQLLHMYMASFFPPGYSNLTNSTRMKISSDFERVLKEAFEEFIFTSLLSLFDKVTMVDDLKVLLENPEFGDLFMKKLDRRMLADVEEIRKRLLQDNLNLIRPHLKQIPSDRKTNFLANRKMSLKELQSGLINRRNKDVDNPLFSMEAHIEVLRIVLNKLPQYLELYPFMNAHQLMCKFLVFTGISKVKPVQNWFVIARLTLNIHSSVPVPVCIQVKTEYPRAVLLVVDTAKCERLPHTFALMANYYLTRNKIGYTLLLCGIVDLEARRHKHLTIPWTIRTIGVDRGNILHPCSTVNPYYCRGPGEYEDNFYTKNVSSIYLPNPENIVGRFIIGISKSLMATIFLSVSNKEVDICLTITDPQEQVVARAEGRGCLCVPVVLLDKEQKVVPEQEGTEEPTIFYGTISLVGEWRLSNAELITPRIVRASSKKDIFSLKDLREMEPPDLSYVELSDVFAETEETIKTSELEESQDLAETEALSEETAPSLSYHGYDSTLSGQSLATCKTEDTSEEVFPSPEISERSSVESMTSSANKSVHSESRSLPERRASECLDDQDDIGYKKESPKALLETIKKPSRRAGITPFWKVSLVLDGKCEDKAFIAKDYLRKEAFEKIKEEWEMLCPGRLLKAKIRRKEFLEENWNDFTKYQLDPDNISISDTSIEEEQVIDSTSSLPNKGVHFLNTEPSGEIEYSSSHPSTSQEMKDNGEPTKLFSRTGHTPRTLPERQDLLKLDGDFDYLEEDVSHESLEPFMTRFQEEKIQFRGDEEEEMKQKGCVLTIDQLIKNTTAKMKSLRSKEGSRSSSSYSGFAERRDGHKFIRCPPEPILTKALIEKYSVPVTGKPVLRHFDQLPEDFRGLTEEEIEKLGHKARISLKRVYKNVVAPILWGISKKREPFCLRDLPIQQYCLTRFSKKLEDTISFYRDDTNVTMHNIQSRIIYANAEFQRAMRPSRQSKKNSSIRDVGRSHGSSQINEIY